MVDPLHLPSFLCNTNTSGIVKFVLAFFKHFETFQQVLRDRSMHVPVIFGNGGGLLFMSFYATCKCPRV